MSLKARRKIAAGAAIASQIGTPQEEARGGLIGPRCAGGNRSERLGLWVGGQLPGRTHWRRRPEADRAPLPLAADTAPIRCSSPRSRDSWLRKLRFYEELQNRSTTRFRVLGVVTRSKLRLQNIAALAASVATNTQRSLFLGVHLPDFMACERPFTSPLFADHRGLHVSLLPSLPAAVTDTSAAAREVHTSERSLTMIRSEAELPAVVAHL